MKYPKDKSFCIYYLGQRESDYGNFHLFSKLQEWVPKKRENNTLAYFTVLKWPKLSTSKNKGGSFPNLKEKVWNKIKEKKKSSTLLYKYNIIWIKSTKDIRNWHITDVKHFF